MSTALVFAAFAVILIAATVFYLFFYRTWRRERELEAPFPVLWSQHLEANMPLYRQLPEGQRLALERRVQLFLSEKEFYGCDGFEVDDKVKVTIAGHACLLILARSYSEFDEVSSILVYPDAYHVRGIESDGLVVSESDQIRAGEASSRGHVVLAWKECEEAVRNPHGGHNVMFHEFAHQLDYLDGTADGAPPLSGEQAKQWKSAMTEAYEDLRHSLQQHHRPWLDPYGATKPAEFFAVLTEAFFQQPDHLVQAQPEVYKVLQEYYRLDPRSFGQDA